MRQYDHESCNDAVKATSIRLFITMNDSNSVSFHSVGYKSSTWSLTWLTYFFTETFILDNFPIYVAAQAPVCLLLLIGNFKKAVFIQKWSFRIIFYLPEFTSTPFILISKIWRPPPAYVAFPFIFGCRDYVEKLS